MKKAARILLCFLAYTFYAKAQVSTFAGLLNRKSEVSPEIVQLPDDQVTYPVTGLIDMHMEQVTVGGAGQGGGGGLFAVIEYWVIDSKGKVVYNNVYALNPRYAPNNEALTDADYLHYMDQNGKFLMRQRKAVAFAASPGSSY